MQRLYQLASKVMDRIFRRSHYSVSRRTVARMDPAVRHALAGDVSDEVHGTNDDWRALEQELADAQKQLRDSEAREQFLGMRIYKYQQRLNDQALLLKDEQAKLRAREDERTTEQPTGNNENDNDHDPEEGGVGGGKCHVENQEILERDRAAWDRRMVKWEEESDLLLSIQETHKAILVDCENMRRQIRNLEKRRVQFKSMRQECASFVAKASQVQAGSDEVNRGSDSPPAPEEEVELSPSTRARSTLLPLETSAQRDETATLLISDSEVEPPV